MWTIKPKLFHRNLLLHQHGKTWVEAYSKKGNFFCCLCQEQYTKPDIAFLMFVMPRPNNRSYWKINSYFFKKELKITPQPTNSSSWDSYGHIHENCTWAPVIIEKNILCPDCLELAPNLDYENVQEIENTEKSFF